MTLQELEAQIDFDAREILVELLERELTERRTDAILDYLVDVGKKHLPWYARWLAGTIRGVLDKLLPEHLVGAIRNALT